MLILKPLQKKLIKPAAHLLVKTTLGSIYQLLYKKAITNVKTPQYLEYFCLSTTKITSEDNLLLQAEELELDDAEQCQQIDNS